MNTKDFKHLGWECDSEYGLAIPLPQLVLAIEYSYDDLKKMATPFNFIHTDFRLIAHQTAGLGCSQHHLSALVLEPANAGVKAAMAELSKQGCDSQYGCWDRPTLSQLVAYQQLVRDLFFGCELSCEHSYSQLEEAYYPVDITPASLAALVAPSNCLPQDLDELLMQDDYNRRHWRSWPHRWQLLILGENSD
jgi:hypothetical protein